MCVATIIAKAAIACGVPYIRLGTECRFLAVFPLCFLSDAPRADAKWKRARGDQPSLAGTALLMRVPVQRHLLQSVRLTAGKRAGASYRRARPSHRSIMVAPGKCGVGMIRLFCTEKKLEVFLFFVAKAPHHVGISRFHRHSVRRTGGPCAACALRSQRGRHRAALRLHSFDRRPRAGHRTNSVRACARRRMEFSSRREPEAHASADDDRTCIALSPTDDRVSEYRWRTTARHRAHVPTARTDRDNTANRQSPRADASDQPSRRAFAMSPEPPATDQPSYA